LLRLYLDSSAIMKRYIDEPGTPAVDLIFDRAERGDLTLTFSLWNIGEVLGVLDERRRRGYLSGTEFKETLNMVADELVKLMRLRVIETIPIFTPILIEAWNLILAHHIYEADALQLITCKYSQSDAILSGDGRLVKTGRKIGLKTFDVVKEQENLINFVKKGSLRDNS